MKLVSGLVLLALAGATDAVAGVGTWTASASSPGGAISVVVGTDGAVYADQGFISTQIARSVDHGATWQPLAPIGDILGYYWTRALSVDPTGAIYAAFTHSGNANYQSRLWVSRDGGASWTLLLKEFQTQYLDLRIDPFSNQTLYLLDGLGGPSRLRRSDDGGAQWTEIDQPIIGYFQGQGAVTAFVLDPHMSGRVDAATLSSEGNAVFYVSNDRGSNWMRTLVVPPSSMTTLVVDPFQAPTIYGGSTAGIFRSDDAGQTFYATNLIPVVQIVADSLHPGRLYAATTASGVLTSSDRGQTWTPLNNGLTNLAVNAIGLDASDGYLYAATSTGVFVYEIPSPGTLFLNAARPFAVSLSATDQRTGRSGAGVGTQVNDLWGWFSIPAITSNPNNPEVFVKLLDGTAINGKYWFFYGGLTDLEYTLTVTEDATGLQKTYTKPAGSECGGSDTAAFGP